MTDHWEPLRRRQQLDHTAGAHAPEHLVGLLADSITGAPPPPHTGSGREWIALLRALADHIYAAGVYEGTRTALETAPARMILHMDPADTADPPRRDLYQLLATPAPPATRHGPAADGVDMYPHSPPSHPSPEELRHRILDGLAALAAGDDKQGAQ